ncbi:16S rRNA (cytosine(967)-C(5))-methyltransferase RsmB [Acinetobacter puyangensis]|uniref:16S rRNA (cytosine(967)-C(5))-methyltransferase RsmB n=1 Tax=Acinetobacter puyangensis TaxID=1096779 RepID=UPI003A4E3C86
MMKPTQSVSSINLRAQLIKLLIAVQQGQSLAQLQNKYLNAINDQDKALFHELSLGILRQWFGLKQVTLPLLQKPISDLPVETALYVGLYQILCTRIADHAAISETVNAVKQLGFESASGLVNAILRRALRERPQLQAQLGAAHGLPSWLYKRLKKDWKSQSDDLCQQLKSSAPLTLRVNQRLIGREAYLDKLLQHDIQAHVCSHSNAGITLDQTVHIPALPGYEQGWFSVQDEHAQLCAMLLPDLNEKFVIDACAAPGGKTAHLLEKYRPAKLIALDADPKRLLRVEENLSRLKLLTEQVEIISADATTWQASQQADCIVLDAPCSAIGVLRRHPDIRLLRQSSDIAQTVQLQKTILNHMWQQLKVGGSLLYITCSILKVENEQQMLDFFATHQDAKEIPLHVDWGIAQAHGRQLLPQQGQGDGFYYCLIEKI